MPILDYQLTPTAERQLQSLPGADEDKLRRDLKNLGHTSGPDRHRKVSGKRNLFRFEIEGASKVSVTPGPRPTRRYEVYYQIDGTQQAVRVATVRELTESRDKERKGIRKMLRSLLP